MSDAIDLWLEDLHRDRVGLKIRLRECLFSATTPFQRIAVYDSHAFGRMLCVGGEIACTDADEAVYSEQLAHPALSAHPHPERVLILGGGDGGVAREALRYASVRQVTVVEIDRQVVETAQAWFPLAAVSFNDPRTRLVIDDAHRWLRGCDEHFDVIMVDAGDLINPASEPFNDEQFQQAVISRLAPNGIMVTPLGNPLLDAEHARETLDALPPGAAVNIYTMSVPTLPGGLWAVAMAGAGDHAVHAPSAQPWHASLCCWTPALQPSLFVLPRHVARSLGL